MSQLTAVKKSSFLTYLRLTWEMSKLSILSAMEYRGNFFLQVVGMIINDLGLIVIWIIFFHQYPQINGWTFNDQALMFAVATVNYSFLMIFTGGAEGLAKIISNGFLDYYLALPKNVLWHATVSRTMVAAIGDFIFGIGMLIISGYTNWEKILLFFLVAAISGFIMYNFLVIVESLAFFFGNIEETADRLFWVLIGFTHYPPSAFSGGLKIVVLTIIPAFFVAAIPVEIIKNFGWQQLGYLAGFAAVSFVIAVWVFNKGLRRYESGNLMHINL